jgi:hypothetical protein
MAYLGFPGQVMESIQQPPKTKGRQENASIVDLHQIHRTCLIRQVRPESNHLVKDDV